MTMVDCRKCGNPFEKPTTRGRPPVRCASCRGVTQETTVTIANTFGFRAPSTVKAEKKPSKLDAKLTAASKPKKNTNGTYSRQALIDHLNENPAPIGAQNVAEVLRGL